MGQDLPLILIVDDDPDLRQLVRLNLEMFPCELIEARDGVHAIEQFATRCPDLIVLDVMMPEFTGWEILRYIRKHEDPYMAATGVLMLTGIGETLNELSSPLYGADDFLNKPFRGIELIEKAKDILKRVQARREALSE